MKKIRKIPGKSVYYVFVVLVIAFFGIPLIWLVVTPFNAHATLAVEIPCPTHIG